MDWHEKAPAVPDWYPKLEELTLSQEEIDQKFPLKLFAYRPEGFGQKTFFVMERTIERAFEAVTASVEKDEVSEPWDWGRYQWEEYEVGEVTTNYNA